jgi:hypothetical protein
MKMVGSNDKGNVGSTVGSKLSLSLGALEADAMVGMAVVGVSVEVERTLDELGADVGSAAVGATVLGEYDGSIDEGSNVGRRVTAEGASVGANVSSVGAKLGSALKIAVGSLLEASVGVAVGNVCTVAAAAAAAALLHKMT